MDKRSDVCRELLLSSCKEKLCLKLGQHSDICVNEYLAEEESKNFRTSALYVHSDLMRIYESIKEQVKYDDYWNRNHSRYWEDQPGNFSKWDEDLEHDDHVEDIRERIDKIEGYIETTQHIEKSRSENNVMSQMDLHTMIVCDIIELQKKRTEWEKSLILNTVEEENKDNEEEDIEKEIELASIEIDRMFKEAECLNLK